MCRFPVQSVIVNRNYIFEALSAQLEIYNSYGYIAFLSFCSKVLPSYNNIASNIAMNG